MTTRTDTESYYDILHVQPNAPAAIIKNAYRALMLGMKQHPDLGGDGTQAARINLAYETLRDKKKREEYDQTLATQSNRATSNPRPASNPYRDYASENGTRCPLCYKFQCVPAGEFMDCVGCGSPLDPPPVGLGTETATRSIERIPKNLAIRITGAGQKKTIEAHLKDLSPQGLGFVLKEDLTAQQVVRISCSQFDGLANIVHKRPNAAGNNFYGAQFLSLRFHSQSGNFISTKL